MMAVTLLGKEIDMAFFVITGACVLLFVVIIFLMVYFAIKYRRSRNENPVDIEGHAPLEFAFLGLSVALVMALFYFGLRPYREMRTNAPLEAIRINVNAQMWAWSFEYEGGRTSPSLVVPVNRPVRMMLKSNDVLHSLYVPAFRIKQDVVPGSVTDTWFVASEPGEYDIMCTEYCGTGHSGMLSKASVVSEADFQNWLGGAEAKAAQKGPLDGKALFKEKGCSACHSVDGSKLVGPTLKGVFGSKVKVMAGGKEKEVVADEEYLRRSELDPNAEVVVGYPAVMPPQKGVLKEEEIKAIIDYIKTLK